MRCSSTFAVRTGWNVPEPTCSVSLAMRTPRAATRSSIAAAKCRPQVGGARVGRQRPRAAALEHRINVLREAHAVELALAPEHRRPHAVAHDKLAARAHAAAPPPARAAAPRPPPP